MNKIKEEQLNEIKEIQSELNEVLNTIGYIESQKHALLHKIKTINERDVEIKKALEEEYGSINVDIETGEYTEIVDEAPLPIDTELSKID
tara:strand:+ start:247 stop:516 length:270 start_codon:yes stop_codon:yes gene_type:complete